MSSLNTTGRAAIGDSTSIANASIAAPDAGVSINNSLSGAFLAQAAAPSPQSMAVSLSGRLTRALEAYEDSPSAQSRKTLNDLLYQTKQLLERQGESLAGDTREFLGTLATQAKARLEGASVTQGPGKKEPSLGERALDATRQTLDVIGNGVNAVTDAIDKVPGGRQAREFAGRVNNGINKQVETWSYGVTNAALLLPDAAAKLLGALPGLGRIEAVRKEAMRIYKQEQESAVDTNSPAFNAGQATTFLFGVASILKSAGLTGGSAGVGSTGGGVGFTGGGAQALKGLSTMSNTEAASTAVGIMKLTPQALRAIDPKVLSAVADGLIKNASNPQVQTALVRLAAVGMLAAQGGKEGNPGLVGGGALPPTPGSPEGTAGAPLSIPNERTPGVNKPDLSGTPETQQQKRDRAALDRKQPLSAEQERENRALRETPRMGSTEFGPQPPSLHEELQGRIEATARVIADAVKESAKGEVPPGLADAIEKEVRRRLGPIPQDPTQKQAETLVGRMIDLVSGKSPQIVGEIVDRAAQSLGSTRSPATAGASPDTGPRTATGSEPPRIVQEAAARTNGWDGANRIGSDVPGEQPLDMPNARSSSSVAAPVLASPVKKAVGSLSIETFGVNVNPALRDVIAQLRADIDRGSTPVGRFDSGAGNEDAVQRALSRNGIDVGSAPSSVRDVITIAQQLDIDAGEFANRLAARIAQGKASVAETSPQNPVIVNGALDPASVDAATKFVTDLYSEGTRIPPRARQVEFDGQTYDVFDNARLAQTGSMFDIDGVEAPSYGVRGLDLTVETADGRTGRLFVKLDKPLEGAPTQIRGALLTADGQSLVLDVDVRRDGAAQPQLQQVTVPITPEQAKVLMQATNAEARTVEGLGARYFPAESLAFLKLASRNNLMGGEAAPNVVLPKIYLNTFGTMGQTAFSGSPAQLVTSLGRSLPFDETTDPVPAGLYGAPGVPVYSGGSALTQTSDGVIAAPFGLSPEQAQGLQNVASELRPLVDELSRDFGLSEQARSSWQDALFADTPDIPSVILSGQVVSELADRTQASHRGRTLADLQEAIDQRLEASIDRNGLREIVTLHHTPTGQKPESNDAVAPHQPGTTEPFTTEWQFAMNGQKALPVLDVLIKDLSDNHGIDLKSELERAGYSYGEIRKLSLSETMEFFSGIVRPMVEAHGSGLTGKVVVAVDTYSEKNGRQSGSDASMINAVKALYGAENTIVVQVDTFAGKLPDDPGRNPAFQTGVDPATGRVTILRPSIDPAGANGDVAPTMYVTTQEEFGRIFNRALQNQSPLSPEEMRVWPEPGTAGARRGL